MHEPVYVWQLPASEIISAQATQYHDSLLE